MYFSASPRVPERVWRFSTMLEVVLRQSVSFFPSITISQCQFSMGKMALFDSVKTVESEAVFLLMPLNC